jgi:hypothetical protein
MTYVRLMHLVVIATLVLAAAFVYRVKYESTKQAERVAKLHMAILQERDTIARLRADWAKLDSPVRVQGLAERHLKLQPIAPTQFDTLDNLPERPPAPVPEVDQIEVLIRNLGSDVGPTGSIPVPTHGPGR